MRQESVSSSDTSMEEEETQEAEEVHMRDLLGNDEEDVEEAASQLMPEDLVDQLVCRSHSAAEEVRSEVTRPGSGLAKLWEDGSLFTQELSQVPTEKQENQPPNKGQLQGKVSAGALVEQVVTLQEEMNVEEVETQKEEEVTVKPAEAATADMELETSLRLS